MNENDKLEVLLLSPSPPPVGGIPTWTVNILDYLKNQDRVNFCYINTSVKYRDLLELGYWKRFKAGIRVTIDVVRAMKNTIRISKPSVVHMTSSASLALFKDILILYIAKKFKTPVIIHWRFGRISELAIKKNWEWRLISLIVSKSAYSIVIDDHSYKTLKNAGFNNVANIANPVSKELAKIAKGQKDVERHLEDGKVVFVGHVEANKGIYELVEACVTSPVVKQLKLIGPFKDEVKTELETMANERADGSWLILTGAKSREEVYSEISSAVLLVLPSYTEGFPNVVLEAMSLGCAVVATDVGAIPEMIDNGCEKPCGICVPIRNVEKLKEAILDFISNPEKAKIMGRNGIEKVLKNFTIEKVFEQYVRVWDNVS